MKKTKIGIIGCGMISDTYFNAAKTFRNIEVIACCDLLPERAQDKAEKFNCKPLSYEALLNDPEVEIVLNLTEPARHAQVLMDSLRANKHAYSEKPFAIDLEDSKLILETAKAKNLYVGGAPDTFLGGAQQTARKVLDDGWIGKPLSGMAIILGRGPEKWPQAPFFYDFGGGPMLDIGPYYITALVNLLGPAKSVIAMTKKGFESRTIGPEVAPQYQDKVQPFGQYPVNVDTHLTGVIEFACGAYITVITSFDVITKDYYYFQLHGSEGTMMIPDPNQFGGDVKIFRPTAAELFTMPPSHIYNENSRSIGIAEMAMAIENRCPARASGELTNHVLEIMLAFEKSSRAGAKIELQSTCTRPRPLPLGLEHGELSVS